MNFIRFENHVINIDNYRLRYTLRW